MAKATGMARITIHSGPKELEDKSPESVDLLSGKTKHAGGGRKKLLEIAPAILEDLKKLVAQLAKTHKVSTSYIYNLQKSASVMKSSCKSNSSPAPNFALLSVKDVSSSYL